MMFSAVSPRRLLVAGVAAAALFGAGFGYGYAVPCGDVGSGDPGKRPIFHRADTADSRFQPWREIDDQI